MTLDSNFFLSWFINDYLNKQINGQSLNVKDSSVDGISSLSAKRSYEQLQHNQTDDSESEDSSHEFKLHRKVELLPKGKRDNGTNRLPKLQVGKRSLGIVRPVHPENSVRKGVPRSIAYRIQGKREKWRFSFEVMNAPMARRIALT